MHIAIIGAGAVGGTVGARLQAAGHRVTFLARGATLRALQTHGLRLDSVDGDLHLATPEVTHDPASVGAVDVVLVTVKSTQVDAVAPSLRPFVGPHTAVIPMQNGVEAGAMLARALGDAAVMDGLAKVIAELVAPGHIRHVAVTPVLEFGARAATPADAPARAQLAPFAAALEAAGLRGIVHADMAPAMWEKFLFIEPFGTVGAVTRAPLGVMRRVPESRALLDACLREVFALAHAAGVAIGEEAITRVWARYDALPPESTASMQRDLMAGRPSEFSLQTGSVVRLAREHGVAVPVHEILYAALLPGAQA